MIFENNYGYLWIHFDFYRLKIRFVFDCFLNWPMEGRADLKLLNSLTFYLDNVRHFQTHDHFELMAVYEVGCHLNKMFIRVFTA